ncbi:hypothetical protein CEB3_c19670 [Peptococcaceae bacterium CEB3]|nr:hypothetical protein CEB3_c19670 [Peptococcaceae bacterium CEB3]
MIMQDVLSSSKVRAEFGRFIDSIVRDKPRAFQRNRDTIFSFSKEQILDLLSTFRLTMEYEQGEDGMFYGSLQQIDDIVGSGASINDLRHNLAVQLIEYAEDYYRDFRRYSNAPNRRSHAPFVWLTLLQNNTENVTELIYG